MKWQHKDRFAQVVRRDPRNQPLRRSKRREPAGDLEIARQVQRRLFPQSLPPLRTLEFAARCEPAGAVGGDYYDFLEVGPGRVAFVLADVSGKGMPAALLMANLQATLRSQPAAAARDLRAFVQSVNRLFHQSTRPQDYATLYFALYGDSSRRLSYVNCGHNPPLLCRANGVVEKLPANATVLGLFDRLEAEVAEVRLDRGDLLAVYSDGITETRGPSGRELGVEGLLALLRTHHAREISPMPGAIARSVQSFSGFGQEDDLTLFVARAN